MKLDAKNGRLIHQAVGIEYRPRKWGSKSGSDRGLKRKWALRVKMQNPQIHASLKIKISELNLKANHIHLITLFCSRIVLEEIKLKLLLSMQEIKNLIEDIASNFHQQVDSCTNVSQILDSTYQYIAVLSHKIIKCPLYQSLDQFTTVYRQLQAQFQKDLAQLELDRKVIIETPKQEIVFDAKNKFASVVKAVASPI